MASRATTCTVEVVLPFLPFPAHQRRSDQIRRAIPGSVISMAESAGGDESLTPPFYGRWIGIIVAKRRERDQQSQLDKIDCFRHWKDSIHIIVLALLVEQASG